MDSTFQDKPLLAIVGPTGSGKSHLAIRMATKLNGEILNADSRQVYRFMDIGTAKPSRIDREIVPHHLFDIVNPDEDFGLAKYLDMAKKMIGEIQQQGKLPFLVGGSGQYVWALLEGWEIPHITPDLEFRTRLEELATEQGPAVLYQKLLQIDPVAAENIDCRNVRRVIRALEVSRRSSLPFSRLKRKKDPGYRTCIIGLSADRAELYRRTDERAENMLQQGLIDEVEQLMQLGFSTGLPSLNSIGYKQVIMHLKKEIDLREALRLIKIDNHRFIRHQYAWFKLSDKRIHWFNIHNEIEAEVLYLISNFLNGC